MSSSIYRAVNTTLIYIECGGEYLMLHRTKKENDCKWESEYMHLFTADGFEGTLKDCDEGELAWIKKKDLLVLPAWEGDKIFLRLLDENVPFFSLKLRYEGETLAEAKLNGKALEVRHG